MRKLALLLTLSLAMSSMTTACGKKEEPVTTPVENVAENVVETTEATEEVETVEEVIEEVAEEETAETEVETTVISPLPSTIDMTALDNCTLAVSFEEGDAYVDDTGAMQLKVTVYDYELFDMIDIANLKEGDTIMIQGNEVVVETMETLESGLIFINGGMDNNGYDLWHNESGVYFEHWYNNAKAYYPVGEATIKVSTEFNFIDSSDLEKEPVTYYPGDFLTSDAGITYGFNPNNTNIVIADGKVVEMTRIYTP